MSARVEFTLNGTPVVITDDGCSLLEALRDRLGVRSPKDGCSPQGQCGCCTVLVDGQARVSCVTPVSRVHGRDITTVEGLASAAAWAESFTVHGASQCGFCTPGIICRLEPLRAAGRLDRSAVEQALLAHLCRCTGWQTIVDAALAFSEPPIPATSHHPGDRSGAAVRTALEGGSPQEVSAAVALGGGGFADDRAPMDALVAVRRSDGSWAVEATVSAARRAAGTVQGRKTTAALWWPIEVPPGEWVRTLQTTWVEPAYLEPDATWCVPGGEPMSPLANGGAFGGKRSASLGDAARRLADEYGRPVRVLLTREDVVRLGPKRPPIALGVRADGTGIARVARTDGIAALIQLAAPGLLVEEVEVPGPPTAVAIRAAGWAEAAIALASLRSGPDTITAPNGATATAEMRDGSLVISVRCGRVRDPVVLRSYCIGAAHMALGWVRSEGIAVDSTTGVPHDLTIRSFGVLRAVDMPHVDVRIEEDDGEPLNGSDAVFAAVAAAAWRDTGFAPRWPLR